VPVLSFVLVPLEVLALLAMLVSDSLALYIWQWCDQFIHWVVEYFEFIVAVGFPVLYRPVDWSWFLYISMICAFVLWFIPGRYVKAALLVGCMPLLFPKESGKFQLRLQVFDVGQGLSVFVSQPNYGLVYDTGRRFSKSFDPGADIIGTTLHQARIPSLEHVIISHPDSDHRGGLEGLASEVDIRELFVGRSFLTPLEMPQTNCQRGQRWTVGAVEYHFLWPDRPTGVLDTSSLVKLSDNDVSCVLMIVAAGIRILIPGDISAYVERQLIRDYPEIKDVDVLLVPHHGSKTSSSEDFVEQVNPAIAIISAGYKNQFGHPHSDVLERYKKRGIRVLNTADVGAIKMQWSNSGNEVLIKNAAELKLFWWQK